MKRNILFTIAFFLLTIPSAQGQLTSEAAQPDTLRGLRGIQFVLFFKRADAMDEAQRPDVLKLLRDDAEAKFKAAGIPLLRAADEMENPGSPTVELSITLDKPNGHVYPVIAEIKLFQKVTLSRDPLIELQASTWQGGGVGIFELKRLDRLKSLIGSMVDRFIKSYLSVNSGSVSTTAPPK